MSMIKLLCGVKIEMDILVSGILRSDDVAYFRSSSNI